MGEQTLKIECVKRNKNIFDFIALTEDSIFIIS